MMILPTISREDFLIARQYQTEKELQHCKDSLFKMPESELKRAYENRIKSLEQKLLTILVLLVEESKPKQIVVKKKHWWKLW